MADPVSEPNQATGLPAASDVGPPPPTRAQRVHALRGKYAFVPFGSDDHMRETAKEIEQEKD